MSASRIRPWLVVTALCFLYALAVIIHRHGDPLALATIGARFSPNDAPRAFSEEGYDGQFVYYIARDPSSAIHYLDVPAYRFQRILLPALGMVLSLGQDALIPWALLAVNLAALAAGTFLVEYLLNEQHVSRWYALGYGLTLGTFGAARLSLPEPLAYALALLAIVLAGRERWALSAAMFALAALAKETTLAFAGGCALYLAFQRRWRPLVAFGVIAVVPFAAWQFILYNRLGVFGVGSGGALATSFEVIPLAGFIRILTEGGIAVFLILGALLAPFVILPTMWGVLQCWRDYRKRAGTLYTYLLLANAAMMLFVPFSTYREPLGILRFIVGLQIGVILYAAERRNIRVLRNSAIWIMTLMFVVPSDFAASVQLVSGD